MHNTGHVFEITILFHVYANTNKSTFHEEFLQDNAISLRFKEVFQYLSNSMSFRSQNNSFSDKEPRVTNVSLY